jgi:hypothetical protein
MPLMGLLRANGSALPCNTPPQDLWWATRKGSIYFYTVCCATAGVKPPPHLARPCSQAVTQGATGTLTANSDLDITGHLEGPRRRLTNL